MCKKGEGTFSEVVKAQNTETGNHYAIKCMKTAFDSAKHVRFFFYVGSVMLREDMYNSIEKWFDSSVY